MIRGIGTSKGIGIGHALIIDEPQIEAKTEIVSDTAAELRRYENVKKKFIADTQNIIEELKKKAGNKFIDIRTEKKYLYSQKLYKALNIQIHADINYL